MSQHDTKECTMTMLQAAHKIERLESELAKAREVMGKLPVTADGVVFIPGNDDWVWYGGRRYKPDLSDGTIPVFLPETEKDVPISNTYSTREAEIAAAQAMKGGD